MARKVVKCFLSCRLTSVSYALAFISQYAKRISQQSPAAKMYKQDRQDPERELPKDALMVS